MNDVSLSPFDLILLFVVAHDLVDVNEATLGSVGRA